ncbi:MAG: hypothetical protein H7A25_06220 [Leptospiraceae bacterium]|nr:hypothetical protein [Leptospiraceae bacterium]MCP5499479.1 hypothetical protein [Leptospiraceae bacterium]
MNTEKLTDSQLEEIINSFEGLALVVGESNEKAIRSSFNTKVKDNHPDSTQDPVLKRLYEDKLKEYINYRDICLKYWNREGLSDEIESYRLKKKITSTFLTYYQKSRPVRYVALSFTLLAGFIYLFDLKGVWKDISRGATYTTQGKTPPKVEKNEKVPESKPEVASASSHVVPEPKDDPEMFPEGVAFIEKFVVHKTGLAIKREPTFTSQTVTLLPFGTKLTVKMTKKVIKLSGTYANWYYIKEVNGYALGEYLVGSEPKDNFPLNLIENTLNNTYTTNLRIKYGSNVISLYKNKVFYYPSRNDRDYTEVGIYHIKDNQIFIQLEDSEIVLKYKAANEFDIVSAKY